jgi:hypothetical protein
VAAFPARPPRLWCLPYNGADPVGATAPAHAHVGRGARTACLEARLEWTRSQRANAAKAGEMAEASAQPRPAWELLPDGTQRIYLALAEGDQRRAHELYERDQQRAPRRPRRRAGRSRTTAAATPPARELGGFVARGSRLVPPEMAAAEAWKRRQAREAQ